MSANLRLLVENQQMSVAVHASKIGPRPWRPTPLRFLPLTPAPAQLTLQDQRDMVAYMKLLE